MIQGIQFRVTGLGVRPYAFSNETGHMKGFEFDMIEIIVKHVKGRFLSEKAVNWLLFDYYENGTMKIDATGMPVMIGSIPDVFYQKSTFAVGECYYIADIYPLADYIVHSNNLLYLRASKPGVSKVRNVGMAPNMYFIAETATNVEHGQTIFSNSLDRLH